MGSKTVYQYTLNPITLWLTLDVDVVDFQTGFLSMFFDATQIRLNYSWWHANFQKVVVASSGVAYAGDAALGNGPKLVTLKFNTGAPVVTMNNVDDVDLSTGWVRITKGNFVIAYVPFIITEVIVEPMP